MPLILSTEISFPTTLLENCLKLNLNSSKQSSDNLVLKTAVVRDLQTLSDSSLEQKLSLM